MRTRTLSVFITLSLLFFFVSASDAATRPVTLEGVGNSVIPAEISWQTAVNTEDMATIETQYDLASPDGTHYARIVLYKDSRDLGLAGQLTGLLGIRQEILPLLSDMGKKQVTRQLEDRGMKLIEWSPVEKINLRKQDGVLISARVTLSERLPLPLFTTFALYQQDNHLRGIGLACADSDREYWRPIFKQLITGLQ